MEGSFAIAPCLLMCCSCSPDTVATCIDVDGLISDEGTNEHVGSFNRGGVQGGGSYGGVPDGESAGLDSVTEEGPEFVIDGVGESGDCREEFVRRACSTSAK